MTRTRRHTPLHCGSARLVESRREAWELENKSPGCLKVLLSSPRREHRLLKFLELSGVGKVECETDEEESRATRLDGVDCIGEGPGGSLSTFSFYFFASC
jgi:hypothetical protein